jgi:tRNA pseudouridine32 synthase/23S rRNA pseudouridine746 synthase
MERGRVVDEYGAPLSPDSPCREGALIFYYRELDHETRIPFVETILYQDDHILVADKPHFLPVIPSGRFLRETLLVRLKRKLKFDSIVPLHRIDRETAGLVTFSLNPETRRNYASLFTKHEARKVYEALAPTLSGGHFPITRRSCLVKGEPFFRMKEANGTPNSETIIDLAVNLGDISLYRLVPVTGRKHQLRVHCAALGIPIMNDKFYPEVHPCKEDDFSSPQKQFLFETP